MTPEYGEFYYLSTEGYFFNYLPIEGNRVEVSLFKEGNGSIPVDKTILISDQVTGEKHHSLINLFESKIMLGQIV